MQEFIAKETIKLHGFQLGLDKDAVSFNILRAMLKGWYENDEIEIIQKLLRAGDKVLEIGSAVGVTTMQVAKMLGEDAIIPYELNPYLVSWAEDNYRRNGYAIQVRREALVAKKAAPEVDFYIHEEFWASSLVKPDGPHDIIKVKTASIDSVVQENAINTLLIDIEGGEKDLLPYMDLSSINKIIMEVHYSVVGKQETNAMLDSLIQQGFFLDLEISSRGVVALYR